MAWNSAALLKKKIFLPFFITQFFGALNDNIFKLSMLTLISYHLSQVQAQSEYYQAIAGALFILPFFLLSATSGQLADKFDKAILIRIIKVFELLLMLIGSFALYYKNIFWMMSTLCGLGIHSTFFGPIKYSILPDHLPQSELLGATGLVDASTFIAILLGTTIGTLAVVDRNDIYLVVIFTMGAAVIGLISSFYIPPAPSHLKNLKIEYLFWRGTFKVLKDTARTRNIFLAILIISWFWLSGAVLMTKLPDYTNYTLGASNKVFAVFLALFSIGIASGSLIVNMIFKGKINLKIVPWAIFAFSCFTTDLYWATVAKKTSAELTSLKLFFHDFNHCRIAADLFFLAFSTGLFVVPLYTYLQVASSATNRARVIAANNIYNALFMVLGSLMIMFLLYLKMDIPQIFLMLSALSTLVALIAWLFLKQMKMPVKKISIS